MAVFRVRLSQPGYRTGSNRGRSRTRTGKKTQGGSQSALDEPKRQSPLSFQTIRTTRTRARDEPRRYEITRSDSHRLKRGQRLNPQQPLLYRQHPVCIYIPVPVRVRACVLSAVEI